MTAAGGGGERGGSRGGTVSTGRADTAPYPTLPFPSPLHEPLTLYPLPKTPPPQPAAIGCPLFAPRL